MNILETQPFGTATTKPALLIVHGLFGSGRNWRAIAKRLSADRQVITVDMRNHGDSFWSEENDYHSLADDLLRVVENFGSPMDVLGHSMGGKAAMILALKNPDQVNRLIVADIAPVAYSHSQTSNIDIMQALPIQNYTRRSEADIDMARYLDDAATRAFLLQSLMFSNEGNSWKLNLPALSQSMDNIVGFPDVSGQYTRKTLFVKGGLSDYVQTSYHTRIKQLFPTAEIETIAGAGHWVHAEAPRPFLESVSRFLT